MRLLSLAALAAAMTVLASGCKGGPSPEERSAESVCTTILPAAQEILDTIDDVIHERAAPGGAALVALNAFAYRGTAITRKLRLELNALSVPDTDAGRLARGYLDTIARPAFEGMAAEERRTRRLPASITLLQSIEGLNRLQFELVRAYGSLVTADVIGAQIPDFKEPFERADSCKELERRARAPRR